MLLPASTGSGESALVTDRSAEVLTLVSVVFEVLLVVSPSAVPVEETEALLNRWVPSATPVPTVTCTVKDVVPFTARVSEREQVTTWTAAEQSVLGAQVVPAGRGSGTLIPPVWVDGPLFVTSKG